MPFSLNSWYNNAGNETDVVLSSKVSIVRNIAGYRFPQYMSKAETEQTVNMINNAFDSFPQADLFTKVRLDTVDALGKKILEERDILSPNVNAEHEQELFIHKNGDFALSINIKDHLRAVSFITGLDTETPYNNVSAVETWLQNRILFSAVSDIGYLSSDILKIGSGMNYGILTSLPGISCSSRLGPIIEKLKEAGCIMNGYYSPASPISLGWLYFITNEICSGGNEQIQLSKFNSLISDILKTERALREDFFLKHKAECTDMVFRSAALALNAKLIDLREAIDIIFKIKLGLNLNYVKGVTHEQCNALFYQIQIGHLAFLLLNKAANYENLLLNDLEIRAMRAALIRQVFFNIKLENV